MSVLGVLICKVLYGMAPKYIEDLLNIKKEGNYSLICDLMIV